MGELLVGGKRTLFKNKVTLELRSKGSEGIINMEI